MGPPPDLIRRGPLRLTAMPGHVCRTRWVRARLSLPCVRAPGLIENNDIFSFLKTGITIKSGGCPTVRNNKIHNGKQGLTVHEQGAGLVEGNEFYENSAINLGLKKVWHGLNKCVAYRVFK